VKEKRDIEDVVVIGVQRVQVTDGSVRVRVLAAATVARTLRLRVWAARTPHAPLLTARLDGSGDALVALPRLPADRTAYVISLDSSLSRATHHYDDTVIHFVSDGLYKHFDIDFAPKVGRHKTCLYSKLETLISAVGSPRFPASFRCCSNVVSSALELYKTVKFLQLIFNRTYFA
jgi:hypothetical protein